MSRAAKTRRIRVKVTLVYTLDKDINSLPYGLHEVILDALAGDGVGRAFKKMGIVGYEPRARVDIGLAKP